MPRSPNGPTSSTLPTIDFEPGAIVRVPYPHVERPIFVPRPALVVSHAPIGPEGSLIWTLMITNQAHQPWPGDVPIMDWERLGLLIPSKVRTAKISTSETRTAALLGKLDLETWDRVKVELGRLLPAS